MKNIIAFVKELFGEYGKDNAFSLGAALAYYTVFSIAPILFILITITSIFFGEEAAQGTIDDEMGALLGEEAGQQLQEIIANVHATGDSWWATLIGIGTLLFGATGVFNELKNSLNRIWELKEKPKSSVWNWIQTRLLSFSVLLGMAFVLLVSLALNAVVLGMGEQLADWLPGLGETAIALLSFVLSFVATVVVFALLFRFLPDARVAWRDIWAGAIFSAVLFTLGKVLIGFYIGTTSVTDTFGAAGALAALMIWAYYNAQILFLGAEFTFVWAKRHGRLVTPDEDAVKIRREEIVPTPTTA